MGNTREEVFTALDIEREYQDTVRKGRENDIDDDKKSLAEMVLYMDVLLQATKLAIYKLKTEEALSLIRKTTAVGVAAMENFGVVKR
jgi:hypothetical protein